MPLDFTPVADGDIFVNTVDNTAVVVAKDDRDAVAGVTMLYKSHFATCPNAKQHRKPKE